ncbi:hypothetical protein B6D60_08030 [candidate division KSB1 bacterium 4484_87]|nr:MAG: hypothetical protein B6D60_08030 [candidate division KSB1 bacterium 4484_87]
MTQRKNPSLTPGIFLIFLGLILLAYKLMPDFLGWREIYPLILLALGLWLIIEALLPNKKERGAIFPGTILFLFGLFFFLRNFEFVPYYYLRDVWPVLLVILGLAFLSLYLVNPRDQGSLIPAGLFLFFGIVLLLNKLHIVNWQIGDLISKYWPVALILVGAGLIASNMRRPRIDEE